MADLVDVKVGMRRADRARLQRLAAQQQRTVAQLMREAVNDFLEAEGHPILADVRTQRPARHAA